VPIRKSVFFHVGTVKTGSTAIQSHLWKNHDQLLGLGIDYLQIRPPRLDLPRYANADFLLDPDTSFDEVQRLLDGSHADQIVISEEGLWGNPRLILHPVFEHHEKTIVIYLRNSADLIASWAAENAEPYNALVDPPADFPPVFQSGPLPIDVGIEQCRYFYAKIFREFFIFLDGFLATGGRLVVRPFERDQLLDHDVVSDFLHLFGTWEKCLPNESLRRDPTLVNPSRSRKFCDVSAIVWKILQARGDAEFYDLALVDAVHAACRSGDDRPVVATLPDELLSAIEEEFRFVERELSLRSSHAGQDILARKIPSVFGDSRPSLAPVDEEEVHVLVDREINRLRADEAAAAKILLEKKLHEVRTALAAALAERDDARADLVLALAERDRARRYPWKYLKHALKSRLNKR
jgi:hypothetical protein